MVDIAVRRTQYTAVNNAVWRHAHVDEYCCVRVHFAWPVAVVKCVVVRTLLLLLLAAAAAAAVIDYVV